MKIRADEEFNNFLIHIRKRVNSIGAYLDDKHRKQSLVLKAPTGNFIFTFTVFQNGESKCEIHMLTKIEKKFNANFISGRIKPRFGYVYFLESKFGYKVGCTKKLTRRIREFDSKLPFPVVIHSYVKCQSYAELEGQLHKYLYHKRLQGEWFDLSEQDFLDVDKILKNRSAERIIYSPEDSII